MCHRVESFIGQVDDFVVAQVKNAKLSESIERSDINALYRIVTGIEDLRKFTIFA